MKSSSGLLTAGCALLCLSILATARAQDTIDLSPSGAAPVGHPIAPPSTLLNSERAMEPPAPAANPGVTVAPKPPTGAASRAAQTASRKVLPEDRLGGTVTTDAVTLAGRDFYTYFSRAWTEIPLSERYVIAVHERPSGRYGSLIWVEFQQKRVFQTFLPIARSNVRGVAESAANLAFQTVIQDDLSNLLFPDADLAKDEI
ncbi:curli assembly protein CsgE,Curli assembly protein CsgE [Burkholderia stabilis]|uniref:Curli production assembly/transport component CsgE n=1 Tax=Burkholderia stabilis TaxID=95485 RepID=A0AAJ5NF12_9BURK|nr:curli assembly protein CsgE,Curli assembly protein CsgE [Burkholderia stabilis]